MSCRLFIADNSKVLCARLVEMFSEFKNLEIVGLAHNVSEARESIIRIKPDVAILDIQMPGGNGIEIIELIRSNDFSTKVIMFTNYPYPQYRKKCMKVGADYFFDKNTEFSKLFEVIKELIHKHNRKLNPKQSL